MTIANAAPSSVSDDELQIERKKLEVWCTPQEFHNNVDALAAKFSLEGRFNSPRLAFLRDAIPWRNLPLNMAQRQVFAWRLNQTNFRTVT